MRNVHTHPTIRPIAATLLIVMTACVVAGCLGKPKIEDRWTRVDFVSSSLHANQTLPPGTIVPIAVSANVTYRSIVTGFAVAELRASGTISSADVNLAPEAERVPMAQDIDRLLQNSVTAGRATRAVTGWDHLIQRIDFNFDGVAPASIDTSGAAPSGMFLLCYLGSGVRVERQGLPDTILITPFPSTQYQVLPVGMELTVTSSGIP